MNDEGPSPPLLLPAGLALKTERTDARCVAAHHLGQDCSVSDDQGAPSKHIVAWETVEEASAAFRQLHGAITSSDRVLVAAHAQGPAGSGRAHDQSHHPCTVRARADEVADEHDFSVLRMRRAHGVARGPRLDLVAETAEQ